MALQVTNVLVKCLNNGLIYSLITNCNPNLLAKWLTKGPFFYYCMAN